MHTWAHHSPALPSSAEHQSMEGSMESKAFGRRSRGRLDEHTGRRARSDAAFKKHV
jgi:hypothetical protein